MPFSLCTHMQSFFCFSEPSTLAKGKNRNEQEVGHPAETRLNVQNEIQHTTYFSTKTQHHAGVNLFLRKGWAGNRSTVKNTDMMDGCV